MPRKISSMRWPARMPGSGTNVSFGTWRIRSWRPTSPRRWGAAAWRAWSASSSTELGVGGRRGGHRRVEHLGVREVARHVDAGERHELEARVRHAFELLGEHLEDHLVDARGARVAALRGSFRFHPARSRRRATRRRAPRRRTARPTRAPHVPASHCCPRPRRRWPPAATGPGGRPRRPRPRTGAGGRRRSAGSRRASSSATDSPGRGDRSKRPRRAPAHCRAARDGVDTRRQAPVRPGRSRAPRRSR